MATPSNLKPRHFNAYFTVNNLNDLEEYMAISEKLAELASGLVTT